VGNFATAGELLRDEARRHPDGLALIDASDPARRWTWAQLLRQATATARALAGSHQPGDVVAIWAPSDTHWVLLELGCLLAGLVVQPIDPTLEPAHVTDALRRTGASTLVVGPDLAGAAPEWQRAFVLGQRVGGPSGRGLPAVRPEMGALLLPTSGTTGQPKSALISHRAVTADAQRVAERMGLVSTDVWLTAMPLHRSGGCGTTVMAALATGAAMVFAPTWEPAAVLGLLDAVDASVFSAFPRALDALVAEVDRNGRRRPGRVRLVQTGGAPVAPALVRSLAGLLGARLSVVYGLTEASPVLTQTDQRDESDDPAASVGRPLRDTELVIVDLDGRTLPPGAVGELWARGPQLMDGYAGNPAATADTIDAGGWLHTGDLGWLDDDGRLHIEGRAGDVICRDGQRWLPGPVERVLAATESVAEAVLVGTDGGEVVAFVRCHAGGAVDEGVLVTAVAESAGPDRVPDRIVFLDEFPALPSGKVRRFVLRQWASQRVAA
jgi:fatty-acyl-CoA synthase